ncbi:type II secretion system F family protein [Sulfurovum sp. XTW-4]|uniref:General secretion pathway protein F n=1 Tax=Sulfurovum xiamenensis TaxID=3019066 RepID=A0ABT7QSE2_9BACT|nr:type II secretion system F family protein [Sulfurovum xiamenensis]MDM5264013.1 type II secretion system F family protein [Sulfurovum xiamenensis]
MLFKYKGFDKTGKKVKGTVTASSEEEAGQKLRTQNIYHEGLTPTKEFSLEAFAKRQMPGELLSTFSKELSSYLKSGMTILTAIKLLENQHEGEKKYVSFLNSVKTMIDEGKSLYHALNTQKVYALPEFFLQSLNVAGQGGKMVEVLTNMGNFFSAQNKVKKQVKGAMTYPAIIFTVAIGMTSFLIAFVVPKITGIFEDTGQALPPITQFVLGLSDFLTAHYIAIIVVILSVILMFKIAYAKIETFHRIIDAMLLKIPVLGSLIQNHELGRFSYILSLMLSSGVAYAQAVQLAKATFANHGLRDLFEKASVKVLEGNKLSNALQMSKGVKLKRNFMQSLALGEESSEVAQILDNTSALYAEENEDKLKLLLSLLEPFMMLFIGVVVGVIVSAMLLPIFTMTQGLQ